MDMDTETLETTMAKTTRIEWTTKSGKMATVIVSLERRIRHLGTDDHLGEITRDEGVEIRVEGTVEGMGKLGNSFSRDLPAAAVKAGMAAMVGRLGVPAQQADEIEAAIEALKASPEYVEQAARRAEKIEEMAALEESRKAIERA